MKLLHVNNFYGADYLNDMVFHGGRTVFGNDYEFTHPARYMLDSWHNKAGIYGKGFTLYCRLPHAEPEPDFINKIQDKYYDYIIFGSAFRYTEHMNLVKQIYPRNRIICLDGEDWGGYHTKFIHEAIYFKRELFTNDNNIHPISFAVPEELIVDKIPDKSKDFGHIDPNNRSTYIFNDEASYYKDYQDSYFGWTQKKAGWDCLRHHEILMNGCFPAFRDYENIPQNILMHFPKYEIAEYYKKHGWNYSEDYNDILNAMLKFQREYGTTKALIKYILETANA